MHLVDGHRRTALVGLVPPVEIGAVFPREIVGAHHAGRGLRAHLGREAEGVALQRQQLARGVEQFKLVALALMRAGDEDLPDARVAALAHHVTAAVPAVEVADHGHA